MVAITWCVWRPLPNGSLKCAQCGFTCKGCRDTARRVCAPSPSNRGTGSSQTAEPLPTKGVGTEIKKLLAIMNFHEQLGCSCASSAVQMDLRGVAYCERSKSWIASVLKAEHDRQGLNCWDEDAVLNYLIPEAARLARESGAYEEPPAPR